MFHLIKEQYDSGNFLRLSSIVCSQFDIYIYHVQHAKTDSIVIAASSILSAERHSYFDEEHPLLLARNVWDIHRRV